MSDNKVKATPEEIAKSNKLSEGFKEANRLAGILATKFNQGVNPDAGKFESFQLWLVDIGVITREQLIDFEIAHIERAIVIMNDMVSQLEAQSRAGAFVKPKDAGKLIGPDGRPL